ncbi:MAG: YkgJ family cysteine cluster protein [Desulfobulbaceae bacterium]|nr:YkgJ family cysteine cluster protein [Desulfobulbaceae bacterium]
MAANKTDLMEEIFTCQRCGHCCHGETTVSLDEEDLRRMVDYLDMDVEDVKSQYLRITGNVVQMKTVDGHCIFYDDGCTVHPGRPWRCRQWPLHPSILSDYANFSAITSSCPGLKIDVGYEKFCEILKGLMDEST